MPDHPTHDENCDQGDLTAADIAADITDLLDQALDMAPSLEAAADMLTHVAIGLASRIDRVNWQTARRDNPDTQHGPEPQIRDLATGELIPTDELPPDLPGMETTEP